MKHKTVFRLSLSKEQMINMKTQYIVRLEHSTKALEGVTVTDPNFEKLFHRMKEDRIVLDKIEESLSVAE